MKVLLINTHDVGGAAKACKCLHSGFLFEGITSNVLLRFKQNNWVNSNCFKQPQQTFTRFDKVRNKVKRILKELKLYNTINVSNIEEQLFLSQRDSRLEMFSFPDSNLDVTTSELYKEAEIVNLHWVANFLDYTSFFKKNTKPVVWTLHDMNPFTGGDHYIEKYMGIDESGYPIIRTVSEEEISIAKKNIELKKKAITKIPSLTIVAPSEWLAAEARRSEVFKNKKVYCIPNSLDSEIYAPRDKNYSRDLLNIPKNKKVILFVADSIDNNRKGFVFLKRAFEQLADSNLVLCAIGNKSSELDSNDNIYELGPIFDEKLMSIAYSAADVFVIPSVMDNLPNTVLESLMCGTPVIGFPVGGIPDMIQDGVNGFITEEISVGSLFKTIKKFLNNPSCFDEFEIRNNAIKKYDQKVQSQKYMNLFNNILNSND
ncbi:glycosyltransferase [Flavobacterium sp. RSP49]|uniref:glycosyltransferase n=1 Tax=Flavobacterium sp. RSP49 TaxID=2497487 RepID=UPI000F82B443|nr:glycosyltransferase [Flavobacterium sp. RSP49]RTZ02915.1 glycosyltransferase [Flavobacterium sp. RSP49]